MIYKIAIGLVLVAVAIQFVPYGKEQTNPPVYAEPSWDSSKTRELFFVACRDCHSHETEWPWYSQYAPMSWLVAHDVRTGRRHFNISMWENQQNQKVDELLDLVREGEMPPWFYLPLHPEAKLNDQQKTDLLRGLQLTFF
ncbi:MAG: heme-binding domain-containing protein [Desulfuromonadales bacterium]|nr:heme-binding domain-containing protein [Desulfuromonadales bacterium]